MHAEFWHQRWADNKIAFHEGEANALLVSHFASLKLPRDSRVFLPLCGKTRDIHWLLSQGYRVCGCELSELAVEQLFAELGVKPRIAQAGALLRYVGEGVDIVVGDIFLLSPELLGPVEAVYDRAALVALPREMRLRYSRHVTQLAHRKGQLLICFEYDQHEMDGPPFAILSDEVRLHYAEAYSVSVLGRVEVRGGLKGHCPAFEAAWLLSKNGEGAETG